MVLILGAGDNPGMVKKSPPQPPRRIIVIPPRPRKRTFLREWRKFRHLSQEQAAPELEVTQGTLSKIERGDIPYNQDFLELAALLYDCDERELLSIDPRAPRREDALLSGFRSASPEVQNIIATILKR